jgi:hypothetical protein
VRKAPSPSPNSAPPCGWICMLVTPVRSYSNPSRIRQFGTRAFRWSVKENHEALQCPWERQYLTAESKTKPTSFSPLGLALCTDEMPSSTARRDSRASISFRSVPPRLPSCRISNKDITLESRRLEAFVLDNSYYWIFNWIKPTRSFGSEHS